MDIASFMLSLVIFLFVHKSTFFNPFHRSGLFSPPRMYGACGALGGKEGGALFGDFFMCGRWEVF